MLMMQIRAFSLVTSPVSSLRRGFAGKSREGPRSRLFAVSPKPKRELGRAARNSDGSKNRYRDKQHEDSSFSSSGSLRSFNEGSRRTRDSREDVPRSGGDWGVKRGQSRPPQRYSGGITPPNLNSPSSGDPWKVLVKKLDSTKDDKSRFGKVESSFMSNKVKQDVPDEMQCIHFAQCSGCSLQGNFASAPIVTRAKMFFKSEDVDMAVHLGNHHEYRTHVKLAVGPLSRWGGLKIGLYREGSHTIEAIPSCRVHHPRINEAVEVIREAAKEVGIKGYQQADLREKRSQRKNGPEKKHVVGSGTGRAEGDLRYLQLSLEEHTGRVQVVLVWNAMTFKEAGQLLPRLVKRLKGRSDLIHSITTNFQQSESNAIFNYHPKAWKLLWGPPVLKQQVGDATFFFKPQIFRQANIDTFASGIIPLVVKNIPEGASVAELYSGVGIMGLNAAKKASEVLCSDSNEYVTEVFDSCVESLENKEDREKLFYEALPAEEAIEEGQCDEAEVLLVDPPRKGLDDGVLDMLIGTHSQVTTPPSLKRLIYVSCGFEALERDTKELLASGKWKIKSADGYVIFPGSNHIETVAVFDYIGPKRTEEVREVGRAPTRLWDDRKDVNDEEH